MPDNISRTLRRSHSLDVDVAIVGAGVVGCSVAACLSLNDISVVVLDRHHDVAEETSKSNTGLADSGWECVPGTLEADLVTRSSRRWEEIADTFDVPFRRCGAVSVARSEEESTRLDEIVAAAAANGVRTRRLSQMELRAVAPYVTDEAVGAVDVPDEGIVDPIRLTLGYAELAARNGVGFCFDSPLVSAEVHGARVTELHTPTRRVRPRFVVNAAGLGADGVSRILGAEQFAVWPRRGEYVILDREVGRRITRAVTQLPSEYTRGVMVVPSTHGSLLLGPTAEDSDDKLDRSTHATVLERVLTDCRRLVPDLAAEHVIKSYSGLRPASDRTYRIEPSETVTNLIHACGIRSTGISSSPEVGRYVRGLLFEQGLEGSPRRTACHRLEPRPRLADGVSAGQLAREPLGRTVVCACEKVTALEIHEACRSALPARSISGIAKRTRATWGRCQGAACLSGVSFIASMYMRTPAWAIPVGDPGTTLGVDKARRG